MTSSVIDGPSCNPTTIAQFSNCEVVSVLTKENPMITVSLMYLLIHLLCKNIKIPELLPTVTRNDLTLGLPSFFVTLTTKGGGVVATPPWISCLVSHIITCNIAMDSAFISAQNGIFSCTLCECTSILQHF